MVRRRCTTAAMVLALFVAILPSPSLAFPWSWTAGSGPSAASLVIKLERWRNLLSRALPAAGEKIGATIDPNGEPGRTDGGDAAPPLEPGSAAEPARAD